MRCRVSLYIPIVYILLSSLSSQAGGFSLLILCACNNCYISIYRSMCIDIKMSVYGNKNSESGQFHTGLIITSLTHVITLYLLIFQV